MMRIRLPFILIVALASICPFISFAKGGDENKDVLRELDRVISGKQSFYAQKEHELDSLKFRLSHTVVDSMKYQLCNELFVQYLHYQADSAWSYLNRKADYLQPDDLLAKGEEIKINKAEVYGVMGMYSEAYALLSQIDSSKLPASTLRYYYSVFRAYYGWVADYSPTSQEKKLFIQKTNAYRDSILVTYQPGMNADIVRAEKIMVEGSPEESLQILKGLLENNPDMRQKAYIYYTLSEVYAAMQDTSNQIRCLALTAISDLRYATREYASLQKLAYLMYEQGDITRAYKYLNCSMEDAVSCNARLRSIEVTEFFPIIDKAYKLKEQKSKLIMRALLGSVSILSLFLIVAVFYLYRWMKKLSATRSDLSRVNGELKAVNEQLHAVNDELEQTGKIKEAYIVHYLEECVLYLDKLGSYRRSLEKLAKRSNVEELYKAIKSEQFIQDERENFYRGFDKSFLELFPDFVQSFHALLEPEARVMPSQGELLTTELRIFALMRLGVTDANNIAHFLDYSLATIYNYRSRARNRAICKETFERDIMNL